jgi:hypothetical protein
MFLEDAGDGQPNLRDYFASTVELYSPFIKKMKAENPQLNVSEVSFARGKGGKRSVGERSSAGISNVSAAVDDRFFEKHEYHALIPEHNEKLLPLSQPPVRARTDAPTNPSTQRDTQLRRVLARVYSVSIQNQITTTVP